MVIACASICNAQEVKIVEKLADGSYVVSIDSVEHRAITGDKAVELSRQKIDLQECRENEARQVQKVEIADRDVVIAKQQTAIEHGNFVRVMALYEKERELRTRTMQFIPHGKVGGLGGKILSFLDGPYGQSLFKLVIPTATFVRTLKAPCSCSP